MAVDEELSARVREALEGLPNIVERKMMGGMCFMINGNMIGGAHRSAKAGDGWLMFRVGKDNDALALARPGAQPVIMGGKKMGGMVFVDETQCDDDQLRSWVSLALSFVATLPPKPSKKN